MLKFLFIVFVIVFILYKLVGVAFRLIFSTITPQRRYDQRSDHSYSRKSQKQDIHIDFVPADKKEKKNFKGGEYIDYEEL